MFKGVERKQSGTIDNIPVCYGVMYQLKFTKIPIPVDINEEKFKGKSFSNCILVNFAITQNVLSELTKIKTLESLNRELEYDLNLPTKLANMFMDFADKNGLKPNQDFMLEKIWTGNKYNPNLSIEILK